MKRRSLKCFEVPVSYKMIWSTFSVQWIWSIWNWMLHEFLKEIMQAGISNMEDIHKLMLWNKTCVFHVHKTIVLIQKTSFFKCAQKLEVHAFWQKLRKNLTKAYLQFRWGISQAATEFRFWIGAQNFEDRLILSAKMKKKNRKINIKK